MPDTIPGFKRPKKCPMCKARFVPIVTWQITCEDVECRKTYKKVMVRDWQNRNRKKYLKYQTEYHGD